MNRCQNVMNGIAIAESGDSRMAAYQWVAEEIERWMNEDGLTQQQVADQIGKNRTYVTKLLQALVRTRTTNSDFQVDWQSGSNKRSEIAMTVPRSHEAQVSLAAELLAKPEVAEEIVRGFTLASSNVQTAVTRQNVEQRDLGKRMAERRLQERAMPISGYHGRIVGKLQEWTGELLAIGPDLVESCENAFLARSIVSSLRDLALQCTRLADRIELDVDPDVIEGKARS